MYLTLNYIPEEYSFLDDTDCSKYFKMLKSGVPKQAVKHKMIMDN